MTTLSVWSHLHALLAQGADPDHPEQYRQRLSAWLQPLDARAVAQLHRGVHELRVRLRTRPLWCAASLLLGRHATDQDFTDFRGWLIAHGQQVCERALQNPDTLAELKLPLDRLGQPVPFLKPVNATPGKVYVRKVGDDDVLDAAIRAEFEHDGRPDDGDDDSHLGWLYWDLPEPAELAATLPALWAQHGQRWMDAAATGELGQPFVGMVKCADVPGLGLVKLGDILMPRGTAQAITVLGISDMKAMLEAEGDHELEDDEADIGLEIRFIARVRDEAGAVQCNQGLSHLLQRWPHEPEDAEPDHSAGPDIDDTDGEVTSDDDSELAAWEARDQQIQDRVAAAIGGEVRVIYAASDEDENELPIDNLDQIAYRGRIRFVETDPLDGERYESDVLTDPTWLDLARVANDLLIALCYEDHVYLEGFDIIRRPKGKPRVAEFVLGS